MEILQGKMDWHTKYFHSENILFSRKIQIRTTYANYKQFNFLPKLIQ